MSAHGHGRAIRQETQVRKFRRSTHANILGTYFALIGLCALVGAILARDSVNKVWYGVLFIIVLVFSIRGFRSGVIQTDSQVLVRAIHWTYRIPRHDVVRFTVMEGPIYGARTRQFLGVEYKDGICRAFKSFNGLKRQDRDRPIEGIVAGLNQRWNL